MMYFKYFTMIFTIIIRCGNFKSLNAHVALSPHSSALPPSRLLPRTLGVSHRGLVPLHLAAMGGHEDVCDELLRAGARLLDASNVSLASFCPAPP